MDQREFVRVRSAIPIDCTFPDAPAIAGETIDISLCGCLVRSGVDAPRAAACIATIFLAGREGPSIRAQAEVVRQDTGGFALRFSELIGADSYDHLRNLIRYNAADPAQADQEFASHLGLRRISAPASD